ncbi:hypothetical protein [Oceanobacillus jordanicus]|uniref:Uncharacterized protein n=1 Tax=Oceanobacillus jordanicus TaxID=2867266 RepID=A0AAW5BHS0_9BACI|nr:hypothetical protein [Oceanobacillus jordanicus]MCG3421226.1 hypothetical protein [Oceanobacillus jordanicus]
MSRLVCGVIDWVAFWVDWEYDMVDCVALLVDWESGVVDWKAITPIQMNDKKRQLHQM